MRLRAVLVAVGICVALGPTEAADAAPRSAPRYWLRGPAFKGSVSDADAKLLRERLWNAVELIVANAGAELVQPPELDRAVAARRDAAQCRDPGATADRRCQLEVSGRLRIDRSIDLTIERHADGGRSGDWRTSVGLYSNGTLGHRGERTLQCSACTVEQLIDSVAAAVETLVSDGSDPGSCELRVATTPAGALVRVDQVLVGTTPFAHRLRESAHLIRVELADHEPFEQRISCGADTQESLTRRLERRASVIGAATEPRSERTQAVSRSASATPTRRQLILRGLGGASAALFLASTGLLVAGLAVDGTSGVESGRPYVYDAQNAMIIGGVGAAAFGGAAVGLLVAGFWPTARAGAPR